MARRPVLAPLPHASECHRAPSTDLFECQTQHDKSHRNQKIQFLITEFRLTQDVVPTFRRPGMSLESSRLGTFVFTVDQFFVGLESATISPIVIFGQSASTVTSFLETFLEKEALMQAV